MSLQKQNLLPVIIYCFKESKESDKTAIGMEEVSWHDELGNTPFFNYKTRNSDAMDMHRDINRPIGWILE